MDLKNNRRGRIKEYAEHFGCEYFEGKRPWHVKCDVAFPSATENEIDKNDAETLVKNGCKVISEGLRYTWTRKSSMALAKLPTQGVSLYQALK